MASILALYHQPADPAAFDEHYRSVHIPLTKKLPGLRTYRVSKGPVRALQGESSYYYIAEMMFDSADAMREALRSPEMQAVAEDLPRFATGGVTALRFDTEEV